MRRIAIVGQPNSGKSTLFNAVAGYKAEVGNFPGTSIEFTLSRLRLADQDVELIDVPGLYSLTGVVSEDLHALTRLASLSPDVIINVLDASLLSRSLELTIELLDLDLPVVVCLNMMDEADRKGVHIDIQRLSEAIGVPVVPSVATRGEGIREVLEAATRVEVPIARRHAVWMSRDVERAVAEASRRIGADAAKRAGLPLRFLALHLLARDRAVASRVELEAPGIAAAVAPLSESLEQAHGRPADVVISSERHALSMNLFESVARVLPRRRRSRRDRLDDFVTHPVLGYIILAVTLTAFFYLVFGVGRLLEGPLLGVFDRLGLWLAAHLPPGTLPGSMAAGLVQGFSGGIGIVLPYLVPFLVGLTLLEDVGYVPRAAFLMDALMHRIGLHGKAIIPFVLGYGCTVPALLSTRILDNRHDRYRTAMLVNLVPCAARTTVIFALVGFFMGAGWAMAFYLLNIVVIAIAGRVLLRVRPGESEGLILEIPSWKAPTLKGVAQKVWFRLREFVVVAWPILIAGSLALSLLEHFRLDSAVNALLSPLTSGLLGLPAAAGITLVFGILRKELTIVMLVAALGTSDFSSVMSTGQMAVFTVFTMFYVPCLATLAMTRTVLGGKSVWVVIGFTTLVALSVALLFRAGFAIAG